MTKRAGLLLLGLIVLVGLGLVALLQLGMVPLPRAGTGTERIELVLQADGADQDGARAGMDKALDEARAIIARRVEALGARETSVSRQGADRIHVKVEGIKDPASVRALILAGGRIELRLVDQGATPEQILSGRAPVGSEILSYSTEEGEEPDRIAVQRRVLVTSGMIEDAGQSFDMTGAPVVAISLTDEGGRRLARVTTDNVGKSLALLLDDAVLVAPMINEPIIGGELQISGNFTVERAKQLAILINSGALPIKLAVVEEKAPLGAHRN